MRIPTQRRSRGFSLLEVLIAVVVLASGLLAMAALQARLASSSADAKARSRIAGLLTSVLDDERGNGYPSIAGFSSKTCSATGDNIQQAICKAEQDGGVSGLSLTQTVTQYYGINGGSSFTTTAPGAGATYADYKLITLSASWTDATAAQRTLSIKNIASALNITGSAAFLDNPLTVSKLTPAVHEEDPSKTAGVIPIAVGANTDAASTNPLPTIDKALTSTSFSTLTYSAGSTDGSYSRTIQKRVETTVAECACKLSSTNPFIDSKGNLDVFLGSTTFRPTYWNGTKYAPPTDAKITPYSNQHPDLVGQQNDLCSVVCRDHHDQQELTGTATSDTVKYDAVTGDSSRYQATVTTSGNGSKATTNVVLTIDSTTKAPVAATTSGTAYLDAARLIRVDGLWRVATDLHAEHVGLLATSPKGFATSPTPDSSSETSYEDFVVDYMGKKLTQLLSGGAAPVANTVYASHGLDTPATIDAVTASNSYRYLHARGTYLDTIEAPALAKLQSVNSTCASADFPTCLLPYLPFNTINVTQLANWKPRSKETTTNGAISVTNSTTSNAVSTCSTSSSIRGCVSGTSASTGTDNLDAAIASLGKSNSAVAASTEVSPYELDSNNKLTDSQSFTVTGSATSSEFFGTVSGPSVTVGSATLPFWTADLSTTNEPWLRWTVGTSADYCFANIGRTDTDPNPYDCVTTVPLAWSSTAPVQATVGNYNQVVQQTVANPCSGGTGTYSQPTLVCFKVSTATVTSTSSSTGSYSATVVTPTSDVQTTAEQTVINITGNGGASNPIPSGSATLNLTFSANGTATGTYTCDAATAVPTFTVPTKCN